MKTKQVQATIRLRLYPTPDQEKKLKEFCGAARWVYNWGLQRWKQRREEGATCAAFDLIRELIFVKKMDATIWLKDSPAKGLNQVLLDLEQAYKRFFKKVAGYPQFKKSGRRDTFSFPQNVHFEGKDLIVLPKVGSILHDGHQDHADHVGALNVLRRGLGSLATS